MTVNLKFDVIKEKTVAFWISVTLCFGLGLGSIAATGAAIFYQSDILFQNAGAIGVACVVVVFAILSQFDARRKSWIYFGNAVSVSDLMISTRNKLPLSPNEVTSAQAGETVQTSLDMLSEFHRKSDNWLLLEVFLLALFTLQWGFGNFLISYFDCGAIKC